MFLSLFPGKIQDCDEDRSELDLVGKNEQASHTSFPSQPPSLLGKQTDLFIHRVRSLDQEITPAQRAVIQKLTSSPEKGHQKDSAQVGKEVSNQDKQSIALGSGPEYTESNGQLEHEKNVHASCKKKEHLVP